MKMDGFAILMWVVDLLLPACMLLGGTLFLKAVPKRIQHGYGYRTRLSMRTQETWRFAHRYFGRLWLIFGGVELGITIGIMIGAILAGAEEALAAWSLVCLTLQLVGLVIPIAPTEKALDLQFDCYGCPLTPMAERLGKEKWPEEKAPAAKK